MMLRQSWGKSSLRAKWGIGIGAVVAALLLWQGLAGLMPHKKKLPVSPVIVGTATRQDVTEWEHAVGTVVADATVNVTARVGGEIVAVGFKEGQDVHAGDVLFRLDPRPLKATVDAAAAALARDGATMASAKADEARNLALFKANAVSAQARDAAVATAKATEATVAADRAALTTARLNLEYATIRSPVAGKTGAIAVQIGNLVVANATTPLVTVTKDRPVKVSFALSQDRLAQILTQQRTGRLIAKVTVEGSDAALTAPVDFVGNAVSASTGTIELRATYANADRCLVPGQMVSVDVALGTLHGAVVVPRNAINQGPGGDYVFVAAGGKVSQVPVEVLYENVAVAAIAGKVRPGALVVTDGQLRVVDGDKVRIAGRGAGRPALLSPGAQ